MDWKKNPDEYILDVYFFLLSMKDILKRILISVISWWLIWYIAYLFFQNTVIVQWWFTEYNTVYYFILTLICLFLFILFGVYPIHFKMTKATLFVLGIALVVIWDTVLLNDITNHVYVGDIFKVVWVLLTLLSWTNILITDKVRKQKQEKNIEIIEV